MAFQKASILVVLLASTAACSKGGNLVIEPGSRPAKNLGIPSVRVNQGGKAFMVQTGGFTADTGVHASVTVQTMSAQSLTNNGSGVTATINKVTK